MDPIHIIAWIIVLIFFAAVIYSLGSWFYYAEAYKMQRPHHFIYRK
jgi:hypothetical protein